MRPTDQELRDLRAKACAATSSIGPPGERGRWWIENEEIVEGFEGTVAKCEQFSVTDFIADANPFVVLRLLDEIDRLRAPRPSTMDVQRLDSMWQSMVEERDRLRAIARDVIKVPHRWKASDEIVRCWFCGKAQPDHRDDHHADCLHPRAVEAIRP